LFNNILVSYVRSYGEPLPHHLASSYSQCSGFHQ